MIWVGRRRDLFAYRSLVAPASAEVITLRRDRRDPELVELMRRVLAEHRAEAIDRSKMILNAGGWSRKARCWWCEQSVWRAIKGALEGAKYRLRDVSQRPAPHPRKPHPQDLVATSRSRSARLIARSARADDSVERKPRAPKVIVSTGRPPATRDRPVRRRCALLRGVGVHARDLDVIMRRAQASLAHQRDVAKMITTVGYLRRLRSWYCEIEHWPQVRELLELAGFRIVPAPDADLSLLAPRTDPPHPSPAAESQIAPAPPITQAAHRRGQLGRGQLARLVAGRAEHSTTRAEG